MKQLKDTTYKGIFSDAWNFMKMHFPVTDSPTFWESCRRDAERIIQKYSSAPEGKFAKEIVLTILDELERGTQ